jgi:hypothetical protein
MGWAAALGGLFEGLNTVGNWHGQQMKDDDDWRHQLQVYNNQIGWRVSDAKKAGIHPLAALGAQTMNYTPAAVGNVNNGNWGQAGRDIGKAIDNSLDQDAKAMKASMLRQQQANQKGKELENQILELQLKDLKNSNKGAPLKQCGDAPCDISGDIADDKLVNFNKPNVNAGVQGRRHGVDMKNKWDVDSEDRFQRTPQDTEAYSFDENPVAAIRGYIRDALDYKKIRAKPWTTESQRMVLRKMPPPTKKGWIVKYNPTTGSYMQFPPGTKRPNAIYYYSRFEKAQLKKFGKQPFYGNRKSGGFPNKMAPSHGLTPWLMK